jgi:threonine/homoserine/homoserine lactone efflux protein
VLFVVSRGVTLGRRAALATVLGNAAGLLVQIVAVAAGLGAVVERSIAAFTVVKLIGAAYLIYLGVQTFRHRGELVDALRAGVAVKPRRQILREGFVVGATNPKSIVLFAAILPQFVDSSRGHVPLQLILLGLVCVAIALVSDSTWAVLSGSVRHWFAGRPQRLRAVGAAGGAVTIGLGVRLLLTRHD